MLELLQITNDPVFARRCDALDSMRLFVDLERLGKAERQAGRNTFITTHHLDDVGRIRDAVRRSPLMVRVNPLHDGSAQEVDKVLALGADQVMLPMFRDAAELAEVCELVARRAPVVALLETASALHAVGTWMGTPGLHEAFVGLNDLHLSLRHRFMFEPLALGMVDNVARAAREHAVKFGFGGIARLNEGQLPGRDVLAEHLRLGSGSVILSRTFNREEAGGLGYEVEVAALRQAELELAGRSADQVEADRRRIAASILRIASDLGGRS